MQPAHWIAPTAAAGKVAPHELNGAGGNANAVLSPTPQIIFILGHEYQHILVDESQLDSFLPMRRGEGGRSASIIVGRWCGILFLG